MMAWTAILLVLGVFVLLGLIFFVIAPRLTHAGKKKRGPSEKKHRK